MVLSDLIDLCDHAIDHTDHNDHTVHPQVKSGVRPRSNWVASVGVAVFGGLSISLLAISLPFVWPALRAHVLPYIPATDSQVKNVLRLVRGHRPSSLIDLGSGDGRIVIECARIGIHSFGVELNPWLVLYSRIRSRILGVHHLTRFEQKNLWKVDTSQYDNVVIFGVQDMMNALQIKIESDCHQNKKQITVIACRFPFVKWQPIETVGTGIDTVWLYHCPNRLTL